MKNYLPRIREIGISIALLLSLTFFFRSYYTLYFNFSNQPKEFMHKENWLVKGKGIEVLPPYVGMADKLLDSARVKDYTVLGQMKTDGDGYIFATLNEEAWPIRYDTASRNVLGYYQDLVQVKGLTIQYNDQGICLGHR